MISAANKAKVYTLLRANKGSTFIPERLVRLCGYSAKTNVRDTWMYKEGFIKHTDRGVWKII